MTEGATHRHSINCKLEHETEKAWLVNDGTKQGWVPKSQGEIFRCADGTYDLFAEEWILKKLGFI